MCSKSYNHSVILLGIFISINLQSCYGKNQNVDRSQDIIEALGMVLPQHFRRNINCSVHDKDDKNIIAYRYHSEPCKLLNVVRFLMYLSSCSLRSFPSRFKSNGPSSNNNHEIKSIVYCCCRKHHRIR